MKDTVFISGATGFLGTELVDWLIKKGQEKIYVLVRAEDEESACHRLRANWYGRKEIYDAIGQRIFPVTGDFTEKGLGLRPKIKGQLLDEVTYVIHTGAEVGLQKESRDYARINIQGTKRMLSLAAKLPRLKRFVHISTAYVSGQRTGVIVEDGSVGEDYSSLYEKSKAKAEGLVRQSGLPFAICRPGMIVGHSKTGRVRQFNTIYYMLKLMLTKPVPVLPVDKHMGLNLVPVDYVAETIGRITFAKEAEGKTFHITCPSDAQPSVEELVDYVRAWAGDQLGLKLTKMAYVPAPAFKRAGLRYNRRKNRKKNLMTNLLTLMPYFYGGQVYDRTNTDEIVGAYALRWQDYIDVLLEFACRKNFMEQTERTVFEQARVRRASKSHPITYYDVAGDELRKVTGPEVNLRIQKVVNALWAWGIRKGDKIALTGVNSVDYVTIDQAIGLLGAVSVPLYYTTPMDEAKILLERSGAQWLFVGDKRFMSHIEELEAEIRIVAFSDGLREYMALSAREDKEAGKNAGQPVREGKETGENAGQPVREGKEAGENAGQGAGLAGIMEWDEFLAAVKETAPVCHVDPDQLATIRYTSGTTGEPKGVMFNYHQLSWMGEVLTNLLSWEERNKTMRYLSFLPQSHVVEGILASYAPYYMLADTELYYLNDFGALVDSLPKIRPTVFFSVPRFYEKVWDQLASNPMGKRYLAMEAGPAKKALGLVLKKVILRKAGLDACKQLIVGSAPISEALLLHFRELGIEIYNAYGQTEAPLITINRLGDNQIPSIGTPLPETSVTADPDGELIVKGPQVCLGYYGLETDTIQDGVLKTGDLGTIDQTGHITLYGRKKDMIITAYGKNISTPKLEERLKNIPGVAEAVLIGENRPYCTALIWPEEEGDQKIIEDPIYLEHMIQEMNAQLSHPEQIRRYEVIKTPLSIQKGELTPNLKVKRKNVEDHYREQIEAMYQ